MSRRILLFVPIGLAACGQDYDLAAPVDVDPASVTACPFTPIPGTRFKRYDCNPVFTGSNEDWIDGGGVGSVGFHAELVLGHPVYQMWYSTGWKDGNYGVGYAISNDGTDWTPSPANPVHTDPGQGWNRDTMGSLTVTWDAFAKQYVLSYQGVNYTTNGNGLGMLTSPDGREWTEANDGDYFIALSEPLNGVRYCWPLAFTWDADAGYLGYINGGQGATSDLCEVYGYGGPSLDDISASPQVLLPAGPGWDRKGASSAAVVKFDDTFYMFYVGFNEWVQDPNDPDFINPYDQQLGIATSPDGITWTKDEANPYRDVALVNEPAVLGSVAAQVVGRRIHLWIGDAYLDYVAPGETEPADVYGIGYYLYEPDSAVF